MTNHRTRREPMPGTIRRRVGLAAQLRDDQPPGVPRSEIPSACHPEKTGMSVRCGENYERGFLAVSARGPCMRTCRDFTTSLLHSWGICDGECHSAVLALGELAADAAQHGHGHTALHLHIGRRSSLIALADFGKGTPDPSSPVGLDADEHGRGMRIVASLAQWIELLHDKHNHQVLVAMPHSRGRTPPEATGDTPTAAGPGAGQAEIFRPPGLP